MGERPHSLVDPEVARAMCKLAQGTPRGCFVEVGVYHGGTAWFLAAVAAQQHRALYLYDTFTGIPYRDDAIDSHHVGDFEDTSLGEVQAAVPYGLCIPGVFPASAVKMGRVAFVHLDCDQYRSYRDALWFLHSYMVPGGVIWCDDADCLNSAGTAVREYCEATGRPLVKAEKIYIQF
jgi:hypothetical protein